MTFETLRDKLTATFRAGWVVDPDDDPTVEYMPTQYPNQPWTVPDTIWSRFSVMEGDRNNAAVGTTFQRTVGVMFLQIFVPEGEGTRSARQAADKMASFLDNQSIAVAAGQNITTRTVSLQDIGLNRDGWYQMNASLEFWFDAVAA